MVCSDREKAKVRDNKIIQFIDDRRFVKREHIQQEFFNSKQAERVCARRLKKLFEREKVNRFRPEIDSSYIYHLIDRKRSNKWSMFVGINEIYYLIARDLKQWQKILKFKLEEDCEILQADALMFLKTTIDGGGKKFFIEYDASYNEFDKISKYCQLKTSDWIKYDWAKSSNGYSFPIVLIVTESKGRKEDIRQLVREQNVSDVNFRVVTMAELRESGVKIILGG